MGVNRDSGRTEVHVWLDVWSEGVDDAKWIVSTQRNGNSDTKSVHDTAPEAMAAGIRLAKRLCAKLFASKSPEDPNYEIDISECSED